MTSRFNFPVRATKPVAVDNTTVINRSALVVDMPGATTFPPAVSVEAPAAPANVTEALAAVLVAEVPVEVPVEVTPVVETPVEETPVEETPVAVDIESQVSAVDDVTEAPQAPVEETPVPAAETPVEEAPVEETPVEAAHADVDWDPTMKKADLLAAASALGLDVDPTSTKAEIIAALKGQTATA